MKRLWRFDVGSFARSTDILLASLLSLATTLRTSFSLFPRIALGDSSTKLKFVKVVIERKKD